MSVPLPTLTSIYEEQLQALYQLEFFGMKLGLENIRALLAFLGNPEQKYPSIHIAGTNGKGSVASMLAAVHQAAGNKVGLYTSPHLIDFRERIRVNGELIPKEYIGGFLERIWPKVEEIRATFFETTTALAFDYFASQNVDVAIIETGLGGRLDSTNALQSPLATVVTSIGYDHMAQLGNTLEAIASEKAGIFKHGSPAVVNCDPSLDHVFRSAAEIAGAPLTLVSEWSVPREYEDITPTLEGAHQTENLKTVLATLSLLPERIDIESVREGIAGTSQLTGIRARLEELKTKDLEARDVRLLMDVGHNEAAVRELAGYFRHQGTRPILVMGIMKDKEAAKVLEILREFSERLVAVQAPSPRSLPSSELAMQAEAAGFETFDIKDVNEGVSFAAELARPGETVLLVGSHYVIGEFLKNFERTGMVILKEAQVPVSRFVSGR